VKPDTLVTVEENNTESNKPTSVAVSINHGQVDLRTPNWSSPDSRAGVSTEDVNAQLHSNSRAAVKSDPEKRESEIVVSSGSAQVQRGEEKIDLAPFENSQFPTARCKNQSRWRLRDLVEPQNPAPMCGEPEAIPSAFRVEGGAERGVVHAAGEHNRDVHENRERRQGKRNIGGYQRARFGRIFLECYGDGREKTK
jgi:hypothetical protein